MENEIQQNIPPVQPLPQTPPSANWSKILLFVVLGLVVVAGSTFIGIQIGKNQTSNQQPTANPAQPETNQVTKPLQITPTEILTKDWKIFSSRTEGFTIKYPNDWHVEDTSDGNCGHTELEGSKCRERYDFISPDQIRVRYVIHKDDNNDKISCGTQSNCDNQNVLEIEQLNITNLGQVGLIKFEREIRLHKQISEETKPVIGRNQHDDFMIDFTLPSKTGGRYGLFLTTTSAGNEPTWLKDITTEQFYNLESVKEGILILKSLSY